MDAWTTVGSGGRPKKNKQNSSKGAVPAAPAPVTTHVPLSLSAPSETSIARHKVNVDEAERELVSSQFYRRLIACLDDSTAADSTHEEMVTGVRSGGEAPHTSHLLPCIQQYIIYGLGSLEQPGAVHIRYQLALASLLARRLPHLKSQPEAYDPIFTPTDHAVLHLYDICITEHNEEGRRIAREPTLFFMPHCEAELTNNLLEINAQAGTLQNVVILGNSFAQYYERWSMARPGQTARQPPATLLELCKSGHVHEVAIDDSDFPVAAAFNDLSLHTFCGSGTHL